MTKDDARVDATASTHPADTHPTNTRPAIAHAPDNEANTLDSPGFDSASPLSVAQAAALANVQDPATTFTLLRQIAIALQQLFKPNCEVVIHDFTDFERSIIFVAGNITNRSVGGPPTDLLLTKARAGDTDEDLFSYLTSLPGGRLMKSSTVFLRYPGGQAYGAFCVNFDITPFMSMRKALGHLVATEEKGDVVETFAEEIEDTIHAIVTDTLHDLGQGIPLMTREEKIDLVGRLNEKGVFQVKKAVPIVADQLGLSRATVYNYLRESKSDRS